MKSLTIALLTIAFSASVSAFQPRTGHWWGPTEGGRGFNIDIQNGLMIVTIFNYKTSGDSEWYLASGVMTNGNHNFTGTLDKYRNGQCISCAYPGTPTSPGNDGPISIAFTSETSANVTLPGGRTAQIIPFNFGFQDLPAGFFGEWVFTYDIISTFAERFNFSTVIPGTSNGNGIAKDVGRNAGCELQTKGSLAGTVLCVDLSSDGSTVQNQYAWRYGLDETYSGLWISPLTGNGYAMKGFRLKGSNGASKLIVSDDDESAAIDSAKRAQQRGVEVAFDPELTAAFSEIAAALR